MKLIKILPFVFFVLYGLELSAGSGPYIIRYSPANPVAGQAVTFTVENDITCQIESIVPDAANDIMNLLELPNSYVYDTPGVYHVALDVEFDQSCGTVRGSNGSKRFLVSNFLMGPIGGELSPSVELNNINCVPLTIAAPAPIPTMSQWGILVLLLLTAIVGVVSTISMSKRSKAID